MSFLTNIQPNRKVGGYLEVNLKDPRIASLKIQCRNGKVAIEADIHHEERPDTLEYFYSMCLSAPTTPQHLHSNVRNLPYSHAKHHLHNPNKLLLDIKCSQGKDRKKSQFAPLGWWMSRQPEENEEKTWPSDERLLELERIWARYQPSMFTEGWKRTGVFKRLSQSDGISDKMVAVSLKHAISQFLLVP